VLDLPL